MKVFTIYGHCGHIGHVAWTFYIKFSPFLRRLHMKFDFDWIQKRSCLKIMNICMNVAPGMGKQPPGVNIFINTIIQSF